MSRGGMYSIWQPEWHICKKTVSLRKALTSFYCTVFKDVQRGTVKYGFRVLQRRSLTILAKWLNDGGGRKLFIKLLVEVSKLSKKHEMEKEGTEKIGSEKLPIVYRMKGKMELRRLGTQG